MLPNVPFCSIVLSAHNAIVHFNFILLVVSVNIILPLINETYFYIYNLS